MATTFRPFVLSSFAMTAPAAPVPMTMTSGLLMRGLGSDMDTPERIYSSPMIRLFMGPS